MAAIDVEPSRRMPDEIVGRCGPENSPLSRADLVSTGLPQRIRANTIPKSSSRPESRARSRFSSGECLHLQAIQPIATLQRPRRSIGEWNTNRARRCAQKVIFDDGPTRSRALMHADRGAPGQSMSRIARGFGHDLGFGAGSAHYHRQRPRSGRSGGGGGRSAADASSTSSNRTWRHRECGSVPHSRCRLRFGAQKP